MRQVRGAAVVGIEEVEEVAGEVGDDGLDAREKTNAEAGTVGERLTFTRTGM